MKCILSLLLIAMVAVASGCSSSSPDEATADAGFGMLANLVSSGQRTSGIRQIWISPRLSAEQNEDIVDTFRADWKSVLDDDGNSVPIIDDKGQFIDSKTLESLWIRNIVIDADGRLWLPCAAVRTVDTEKEIRYGKTFCFVKFSPRYCHNKNCTFDVWVHPSGDVGTITDKTGWMGSPDQWVHGRFSWKDVFHMNYRDYTRKLREQKPQDQRYQVGLFVHVKDGKLTFRNAFEEKD